MRSHLVRPIGRYVVGRLPSGRPTFYAAPIRPFTHSTRAYGPADNDEIAGLAPLAYPRVVNYTSRQVVDLRSDTMMPPTPAILEAMKSAEFGNDDWGEDKAVQKLEAYCADIAGKEAALFCMSGTMANQLGIRVLLGKPPAGVLCHVEAHIYKYEAGTMSTVHGAMMQGIRPVSGRNKFLTLKDVKEHVVLTDDIHSCPTRVLSLEVPHDGMVMEPVECAKFREFAESNNIRMHLDGARLWEAVAAAKASTTIQTYTNYFDTVTLCLSKGLGAPMGSVVCGKKADIEYARWLRKSMGGGWKHAGPLAAAAMVALKGVWEQKAFDRNAYLLRQSHSLARQIAQLWTDMGGHLKYFKIPETNMVWLDLERSGIRAQDLEDSAKAEKVLLSGDRIVTHWQAFMCRKDVLEGLERAFNRVLSNANPAMSKEEAPKQGRYAST